MGNFNQCVDVRIVRVHGYWAVKLTGGFGNKAVKVTDCLDEARSVAKSTAHKYRVPLIEFDENGRQVKMTPWKKLGPFR